MPTSSSVGVTQGPLPPLRRASTSLKRDEILALIRECDTVLQTDPFCLHTRAVRGHALMKAKLWDHGVADFTAILQIRPDDLHARFSRGMALFKSGRIDEAHADFSRVLELNPHHVMARYARAGCYNTEGKFHHAIEEYTIALQHDEMENDLLHGVRSNSTARGWLHDAANMKNDDAVRIHEQLRRATERRATLSAASWSPPKRPEEPATKRESAPAVAVLPHGSEPPTSTTTVPKRPRKVVQVKLNLSDLTPTSQPSAAAPLVPLAPVSQDPTSAISAEKIHTTSSSPPRHVDVQPVTSPRPQSSSISSVRAVTSVHIDHQGDPARFFQTTSDTSAQAPAARRAVRRVTVTL